MRHWRRACGRTSSGACTGWRRHSSTKHPRSHCCSLDPRHGWLHEPSWGQALSQPEVPKGTSACSSPSSTPGSSHGRSSGQRRHQQASVTAVAQAAGTLRAGERQGQMPLSGRPWLCPARQREALSEGSPGTMQIFHQPRREGGQCPPAFKEWCQRQRRRRRQVPV